MPVLVGFKEGYAPVVTQVSTGDDGILTKIAKEIVAIANVKWTLKFPVDPDDITNCFTLEHIIDGKKVNLQFFRPLHTQTAPSGSLITSTQDNFYYIDVTYGVDTIASPYVQPSAPDVDGNFDVPGHWGTDLGSVRSRFSWFKTESLATVKSWLPVQYWISLTNERLAIVLAGDQSADKEDRILSFGYFGEADVFADNQGALSSNFGVTVGSDMDPGDLLTTAEKTQYGDRTGSGVTDISMLKTFSGYPMQAHQAAFTSPDEFTDKKLEGPSQYTGKYHMSPVYIFHGFDGYRGKLNGVIATDRSTVVNLDDLIHNYNLASGSEVAPDTKDTYKTFLVNSPYCILNNATNVLYGIAMLKSSDAI